MNTLYSSFLRLRLVFFYVLALGVSFLVQETYAAFTLDCATVVGIPPSECRILKSLYEYTSGDSWENNANWGANPDPSTWHGIILSGGHVSEIRLFQNTLTLTLLPDFSFSGLTQLVTLDLGNNRITGEIPPSLFSGMSTLRRLNIEGNLFTGNIPPGLFQGLTNLRYLYFENNKLSGEIPATLFSSLPRLEILSFWGNAFSGAIPETLFSGLTSLRELSFFENQFSGAIPAGLFSGLPNLYYLVFSGNHFSGAIPETLFSNLVSLRNLNFGGNQFSGAIPATLFQGRSLMETLSFEKNQFTGTLPVGLLSGMNVLEGLYIADNQFSGEYPYESLSGLTALKYLDIRGNLFTGTVPTDALSRYPNLNNIDLSNNAFTGVLDPLFFSGLSELRQVLLYSNDFSGIFPSLSSNPLVNLLSIHSNNYRFDGLATLVGNTITQVFYNQQKDFPLVFSGNTIDASKAGTITGGINRYSIYRDNTLVATQIDDPTYTLTSSGRYLVSVTNSLLTGLTLTSTVADYGTGVNTPRFAPGFCTTVSIPQNECLALEQLFENTNGSGWNDNTNWGQSPDVSTWDRISLTGDHVTGIGLAGNSLSGELTQSGFTLSPFTELTFFSVSENTLSGDIPPTFFSGLTQLESVYLHSNNLSGSFPFAALQNKPLLGTLQIHSNGFGGNIPAGAFSGLTNLQSLDFSNNLFDGILPSDLFNALPNLSSLQFHSNNFSGPVPSLMTNMGLTFLATYGNRFNFSDLKSVTEVTIAPEFNTYSPQEIFSLTRSGNTINAENAGTLSGGTSTYEWYTSTGVLVFTGTNDPRFTPPFSGEIYTQAYNSLLPNLTLLSDTVTVTDLPDTTPPTVTLAGSGTVNLTLGSNFVEEGASWIDDRDGSGSTFTGSYGAIGSFARSGSVNTGVLGTYTIVYRKVDLAGNSGSTTRTIIVTDLPRGGGGGGGGGSSGGGSSGGGSSGGGSSGGNAGGGSSMNPPPPSGTNTGGTIGTGSSRPGFTPIPFLKYPDITLFTRSKPYCSGNILHNLDDTRLDKYYDQFRIARGSYTPLSRAEFLRIVLEFVEADLSGERSLSGTRYFPDVPPRAWYRVYVNYATRHGIVSGNNGVFSPNARITRAEAMKILIHALGEEGREYTSVFIDVPSTHTLARFIQSVFEKCVLSGKNTVNGKIIGNARGRIFDPESGITGPETLKILYNMKH